LHEADTATTLHDDVQRHLAQAREAASLADFEQALERNRQARETAERLGLLGDRVEALRWEGVSLYRLERLEDSERTLMEAVRLADEGDAARQAALVRNHLGATLRRLGRLDESLDVFERGLREADRAGEMGVRARLLGNLGATWDVLGQRARADDCYTRHEELVRSMRDEGRRAYAYGFTGRAARLRGDLDVAAEKLREEERAARSTGDADQLLTATLHRGELALAQPTATPPGASERPAKERLVDAHACFLEVLDGGLSRDNRRRALRATQRLVECERLLDRLPDAFDRLDGGRALCAGLGNDYHAVEFHRAAARLCQGAGLHGEALWYLEWAVETRCHVIEQLPNEAVQRLARPRVTELAEDARRLVQEAFAVSRTEQEEERLRSLVDRVGRLAPEDGECLARSLDGRDVATAHSVWEWQRALRRRSEELWERRIGRAWFGRLAAKTKDDLRLSEVAYSGAVGDVGRSAHLLAIAVERELRERLARPTSLLLAEHFPGGADGGLPKELATGLREGRPLGLGPLLELLEAVVRRRPRREVSPVLRQSLGPGLERLEGCGERLRQVRCVDNGTTNAVEIRNAVAHGRGDAASLNRLAADAIKRAVALDLPVLLESIADLAPG